MKNTIYSRRLFIGKSGVLTAGIILTPYRNIWDELMESGFTIPKIKITGIRIHPVRQEFKQPIGYCCSGETLGLKSTGGSVVEVLTDQGITGWGEGSVGANLQRNPSAVIGRSPFEAEAIYDELGGYMRDVSEPGGLDIALWDIMGQAVGKPVCELLGHVYRKRVMPYGSAGYRKDWPDLAAGFANEEVYCVKELGFRAVKMKTGYGPETDVRIIRAVREAIGPDIKLGIDSGTPGIYDDGTAVGLGRQLEEFNLEFWEEPIEKYDLEGYDRLRSVLRIPLASGEALPVDWVIKNYIQRQTIDIVQPDINYAGFTGAKRINYAAWNNRIRVMPHTWGTPIRIAATMHWTACIPDWSASFVNPPPVLFELHLPHESPAWDMTEKWIEVDKKDGMIAVPQEPGLGIKVLPEVLKKYRAGDVIEIK